MVGENGCQLLFVGEKGFDGALRQLGEGLLVQNAFGLRRQRQEADQDVGLRQELVEPALAVEAGNAGDGLGTAAPAGEAEAEGLTTDSIIAEAVEKTPKTEAPAA